MDKLVVAALAGVIFLTGCSYLDSKAQENPPTLREQQCMALKNQLNFSKTDNMIGSSDISGETSPTQKASLMQDYKKYNCTDFETKKPVE